MKIHEKDSANSIPNSPILSPTKRRRASVKHKLSQDEDERSDEPPGKKVSKISVISPSAICAPGEWSHMELHVVLQVLEDSGADEQGLNKGQEDVLSCPICFKTLNSRNDLDAHMETHPDTTLRYKHTHHKHAV